MGDFGPTRPAGPAGSGRARAENPPRSQIGMFIQSAHDIVDGLVDILELKPFPFIMPSH